MSKPLVPLALALALAACAKEPAPTAQPAPAPATTAAAEPSGDEKLARGEVPQGRDVTDPDGVVRRGDKLTDAPTITVDQAFTDAKALAGKNVKITGTVVSVCAKKGCWFEVKGPSDKSMRITAKDYKFFVPQKAAGMIATIEGQLEVKTLSQAEAQHFEEDAVEGTGKEAKKIDGPVDELTIAAVGLEMKSAGG
jgi:hypothetical protein